MLKSVEHLRDLTMFWFVSPFLARFHKHFRIDGWILVMQPDLLRCALQASQAISQVHMILFSVQPVNAELMVFVQLL